MGAGKLRHRVELQQQSTAKDDFGQVIPGAWTTAATVWAHVVHLSGIESIKSGADTSTTRASVRIRHRSGVNAGMRLVHDGRVYDIEGVNPDDHKAFIDLVCEAVNLQS